MNIHETGNEEERNIQRQGFLSCHLCLNAQTNDLHTEPDASYTVISVSQRIKSLTNAEKTNKAQFEFMLNGQEILIIPMHPGTIISYSGYMLTHRQQLVNFDPLALPFVNIVAYNSKRLFANLMESFHRDIKADKKSLRSNKTVK